MSRFFGKYGSGISLERCFQVWGVSQYLTRLKVLAIKSNNFNLYFLHRNKDFIQRINLSFYVDDFIQQWKSITVLSKIRSPGIVHSFEMFSNLYSLAFIRTRNNLKPLLNQLMCIKNLLQLNP